MYGNLMANCLGMSFAPNVTLSRWGWSSTHLRTLKMQQAFVGTSFCDFHTACLFLCVHDCGNWDLSCVLAGSSRLASSELKNGQLKCSVTG